MPQMITAMVALAGKATPSFGGIVATLRRLFPETMRNVSPAPQDAGQEATMLVPVGTHVLTFMHMPFAIPPETLKGALDSEIVWDGARQAFAAHKSHFVVACLGEKGSDHDAVHRQMRLVSMGAAAIIETLQALGVYFGHGEYVVEPGPFAREMHGLEQGGLPVDQWVAIRLYPGPRYNPGRPEVQVTTQGLSAFVGIELEIDPSTKPVPELAAAALDTARFIIAKGLVFNQDDSIGSGPSPTWRIHTLNEGARTALPVYRLEPLAAQA
ncbi:MAG: hypothetical protein IOD03_18195 [Methylocystis sp.]|jgi:hypothetical protein|nr:hypothetical protein [Methylocystis sp.]MCA3593365.1 hypothetical protein [Methylocystis sp.]